MKKTLVLLLLCLSVGVANAEMIASLPNEAGGKIVITDQPCVHEGKNWPKLNRAYNYGTAGYSSEGCWAIEDEVVTIVWLDNSKTMRYPLSNFTINPNYSKRKNGRTY